VNDTALVTRSIPSVNLSPYVGQHLRFAFILTTTSQTGYEVGIVDNVRVNIPTPPTPNPVPPSALLTLLGLGGGAAWEARRRFLNRRSA
jgi:hypothetical protein